MATLTLTEITRLFSEATLEVLQEQGMSEKARCCIVFEEAHSLIPEWMAVVSEGDKTATNGTPMFGRLLVELLLNKFSELQTCLRQGFGRQGLRHMIAQRACPPEF